MNIESTKSPRIITDAACPGCACLCDDLTLHVENDRIIEAIGGCERGKRWFESNQDQPVSGPMILEQPASLDVALDRAAELLGKARAPAICGLADASIEVQRIALSIADRIGAVVGLGGDDPGGLRAFQRLGEVSATFGEIKDRADLIVYDAAVPPSIPERFRERIADDAKGRFTPQGRSGKTIIWLGSVAPDDRNRVDVIIPVEPAKRVAFYTVVRALVNGVTLEADRVERATGIALTSLIDLAAQLARSSYGVLVLDGKLHSAAEYEAKLALVRDLNARTRFVVVHPETSPTNATGARSVLTWQAGAAGDVDFGGGSPRHTPRDGVRERLGRGEIDTALIVSNGWTEAMDASCPRILVHAEHAEPIGRSFDVRFPTARLGYDEGGTVARADGVMLPLRPPFLGLRISQVEVLSGIAAKLALRPQDHTR